jgi:pyruvate dehydrogenase E2 component (dihydrolipoamide acetyltransferase)
VTPVPARWLPNSAGCGYLHPLASEPATRVDPRWSGTGSGARPREDVGVPQRAATAINRRFRPLQLLRRQVRRSRTAACGCEAIAALSPANRDIPRAIWHHHRPESRFDWLSKENERRSVTDRLLYGVLLLKATALALREVPELNAFWQEDRLVIQRPIHLGVAVSMRGGGLIAPALHDADHKSITDLMRELRDLVARVRAGGLRSSELSDPTITVTSLGEQGVEAVYGVIYPPQVALVGFGKIETG